MVKHMQHTEYHLNLRQMRLIRFNNSSQFVASSEEIELLFRGGAAEGDTNRVYWILLLWKVEEFKFSS